MCKFIKISLFTFLAVFNISCNLGNNNVKEMTNFNFKYNYDDNCLKSYSEFPELNKKYKKEISEKELSRQIEKAVSNKKTRGVNFNAADLKKIIIEKLNIEFLLKNINKRKLIVTTIAEKDYIDYIEKKLLFQDKHVGQFEVLMLIPKKDKLKFPAIIGCHGHYDNSTVFKENYMGKDLVREGFIMLMPSFRAMNYDEEESSISKKLLLNGFTLMGIRVYETLLVLKYIKYNERIDKNRVGIISHSGGNSVANLVCRIDDSINAEVSDYQINYLDFLNKDNNLIHCETIPSLSYYSNQINETKTLPFHIFKVPYGFKDNRQSILKYFNENLKSE